MSSPWATGDTLTTLRPVQLDVVLDQKVWPTLAIVMQSLAHPLILGPNFLKPNQPNRRLTVKLTPSKQNQKYIQQIFIVLEAPPPLS